MGGPEKLEDVRPFLYNLFSDRGIIRLGPSFMQKPLAWWISKRRAPKSTKTYELIGGGSPLTHISREQGQALGKELNKEGDYIVTCAMRYWYPDTETALQKMTDAGVTEIIVLTLYPHYSRATTGSSVQELKDAVARADINVALTFIESWPDQKSYVQALATKIEEAARKFTTPFQVVYSAHSLPVSFIEEGDPYVDHIHITINEVEKLTKLPGRLCFQSRSGPVEWLSPSTPDMLKTLAEEGCENILMVPISFVSDHVETLYEIDMLYHDQAKGLGMQLIASKSLNCDPTFIKGLQELVCSNR